MSTDLDMQVELIGLNTMREALLEFPKLSTRRAILRKAHSAWGKIVQRRAKILAPKRNEPPIKKYGGPSRVKPGRLIASITSRMSKRSKDLAMVWLVYPWMSRKKKAWEPKNAYYRHFIEFGFTHVRKGAWIPAQPFINPAFQQTYQEGLTVYQAEMMRSILMAAVKIRHGPHDIIRVNSKGQISRIGGGNIHE